jgi:hypothetical protein
MCLFASSSQTGIPICTKQGMVIARDEKEIIGRSNPGPKLFVSKRRLQKLTPQHRNLFWVRVLTRKLYVAPKLSTRRMAPRQNLFVSERRLQELRAQTRKLSWFRVSVKVLGLGIIFSIIFNDTWPPGWHTAWHTWNHDGSPDGRRSDADTRCHLLSRWALECHKTRRW